MGLDVRRTGKCEAARQGRCSLSHDPTKITICGRWLRGTCTRANCPLQHDLQPHLLPVCTFFLQVLQMTHNIYHHISGGLCQRPIVSLPNCLLAGHHVALSCQMAASHPLHVLFGTGFVESIVLMVTP